MFLFIKCLQQTKRRRLKYKFTANKHRHTVHNFWTTHVDLERSAYTLKSPKFTDRCEWTVTSKSCPDQLDVQSSIQASRAAYQSSPSTLLAHWIPNSAPRTNCLGKQLDKAVLILKHCWSFTMTTHQNAFPANHLALARGTTNFGPFVEWIRAPKWILHWIQISAVLLMYILTQPVCWHYTSIRYTSVTTSVCLIWKSFTWVEQYH